MTSQPPSLEYSPEALEGGVTVRRTEEGVSISIRWSTGRILNALIAPLGIMLIALVTLYFLFWLPLRSGGGGWWGVTFPVFFALIALLQAVLGTFPLLFPIAIEVNAEFVTLRWRALTEMRSLVWARAHIRNITVERFRPKNGALKHWYLVLHQLNAGNISVLTTKRAQLELVGKVLREVLALSTESHPALRIDAPKGCRYRRLEWGGGILLVIPPRRERAMLMIAASACMALSGGVAGFFAWLKGWDEFNFGGVVLFAVTGLMIGALLFLLVYEGLKKLGHRTRILISPMVIQVIQPGMLHPLNVVWKPDQMKEAVAVDTARNASSLQLIPHEGLALVVAERQRPEDARWAAAVLNACLRAPMTRPDEQAG